MDKNSKEFHLVVRFGDWILDEHPEWRQRVLDFMAGELNRQMGFWLFDSPITWKEKL